MPVETSKTEGELTKEAPFFIGASPAKVLSKFHHPAFFPELSPTTTTEKYSSLLSDTSTGMGRGVSQAQLLSELQKGYGNRYTERVIAEYREKSKEDLEGKEEPTEAKETEKVTVPKEAKKTPHFRIRSESLGSPGPTFNLVGTQNLVVPTKQCGSIISRGYISWLLVAHGEKSGVYKAKKVDIFKPALLCRDYPEFTPNIFDFPRPSVFNMRFCPRLADWSAVVYT